MGSRPGNGRAKKKKQHPMNPPLLSAWLAENGPLQLELLLKAVMFHPATPLLLTDDERTHHEASVGAGRLLGLPRDKIIGRTLDELADAGFKPIIQEKWQSFLAEGQQQGLLELIGADGGPREADYAARGNVLPSRHLLVLRAKGSGESPESRPAPGWVRDYALFLRDAEGRIVAWYAGAERIYGYKAAEAEGKQLSFLNSGDDPLFQLLQNLKRAASDGHAVFEGWHVKADGTRFWASLVTISLKDSDGILQGFATVVRDFSERHERDEKLRQSRTKIYTIPSHSVISGVVSGEFDRIPQANDAFLDLIGYTREDLVEGRVEWPELTPIEYLAADELAHEEGLRYGACTPYEKELRAKDGTLVPVLVATAVLKLSPFRWISFVQDLRERERLEGVKADELDPTMDFSEMVGESPGLRRVQRQIEVVAPTASTVLILGETGTGKELIARAIHRLSPRTNFPFVTLNCAAIPTGLLESELFGYERGAFTGALAQKIGRFEMANRGTLFLDEVGDIPIELQPKLLRALQEKAFERLGGTRTIPIDVRLVAATNRNLTQMMGDKLFRSDLYYRLNVFPLLSPLLRDRPGDIPLLARYFTQKYSERMGRQVETIAPDTMRALVSWPWPGNIRELENFIERSVILSTGTVLRAPLDEIRNAALPAGGSSTLEQVEREHIVRTLRECGGVVTATATRLGLHRTTLNAIMRKLGISRKDI